MKPKITLNATEEMVKQLGEEWSGKYVFHQLTGQEFFDIDDELIDELRKQGKDVMLVPQNMVNQQIIYKSVTHNGKPIKDELPIPAKLLNILLQPALKLNTLTLQESTDIFLQPSKGKKEDSKDQEPT